MARAKAIEHPGRKIGKPSGVWIDELVALQKAIWLCWRCAHKFGNDKAVKSRGYWRDRRFPYVAGKCDDCRNFSPRAMLFVPEKYVSGTGNRSKSGHSWMHC